MRTGDRKKRYTIGLTAYRIGINYTNNLNIMNVMEPELKKFAHEIGKDCVFRGTVRLRGRLYL